MPRLTKKTPSCRLHRSTGQAVVVLDGRTIYLGKFGTDASRAEFDRLVGEWLANGRRLPGRASDRTILEAIDRFWTHAQSFYVDADGKPTREADNFRDALRPLRRLYGSTQIGDFGPLGFQALVAEFVKLGWCRNVVNRRAARVKQFFKWSVAQELCPPAVHQAIAAVAGLRKGRTAARETAAVKPVPIEHVNAILPHLSPTVRAMVELQLVSGMRSGELLSMRPMDIDASGDVWTYKPASHKTQHHGHEKSRAARSKIPGDPVALHAACGRRLPLLPARVRGVVQRAASEESKDADDAESGEATAEGEPQTSAARTIRRGRIQAGRPTRLRSGRRPGVESAQASPQRRNRAT